MIWILLIVLVLGFLFWPKIKTMFGGKTETSNTTTTSTGAGNAGPAPLQTANGQTVITKPATVGPLATLLGSGVGSIVGTGVSTVLSVPRNLFSGIFKR